MHENIPKPKLNTMCDVKQFVIERGASVVGIAPASVFDNAPPGHSATDIIPGAKSVVVFGIKLVSGVVNWPQLVWDSSRPTRIRCWQVYDQCGFDAINMRLEQIGMDLAIAFELGEFQSIYFPGSDDMTVTHLNAMRLYGDKECPQPLDKKKLDDLKTRMQKPSWFSAISHFSYRHAAVLAGLAAFGANNLALHPVFGPRIRFNVVITEAEMDQYDQPLTEPVCLYDKGCRECIRTCPHGLFHEVQRFEFAGLSHPWSQMRGTCYYSSIPCGGTCIQTCPAGSSDIKMKKAVKKRFSCQK